MSNTHAISLKRSSALAAALAFMAVLFAVNLASIFGAQVGAAQLTSRSLTLSSTLPGTEPGDGVAGSATNGSDAIWNFSFTAPSAGGTSLTLLVCTDPIAAGCTTAGAGAPTGLDMSGATSSDGTVSAATGNSLTFTDTIVQGSNTFAIADIVNPNEISAFFVRIVTSAGDDGVVASAITEGIEITARVKETLGFSTGAVVAGGVDTPSTTCAPITTSGAVTLGNPTENALDVNTSYINYSAFRLYTNAANGVVVTYEGELPQRGGGVYSPTADALNSIGATSTASAAGTEQFGIAVDGGIGGNGGATTTTVNSITGGAGNVTTTYLNDDTVFDLTGTPVAGVLTIPTNYRNGETNSYAFTASQANANAAVTIANAASYVDCVTVPVKYVANIGPLTPAGTYTTTIVYSAVPTY